LKLSDIPNLPGVELYPTLEVVPSNAKTDAFLAHSAVPVGFTNEDFEQVAAGNYLVKVIYLPDPQFQELAATGPGEVVSTRLEPGVDPIAEAHRRGNILLVIRLGNIDLDLANSPPLDAPAGQMNGHASRAGMPGYGMPMMMGPNGPMMGTPGMQPPAALPPGSMTNPPAQPPMTTPGPVSKLPDPATVQQTSVVDHKPAEKKTSWTPTWFWPSGSSGK
jgi:hypothetical protein